MTMDREFHTSYGLPLKIVGSARGYRILTGVLTMLTLMGVDKSLHVHSSSSVCMQLQGHSPVGEPIQSMVKSR